MILSQNFPKLKPQHNVVVVCYHVMVNTDKKLSYCWETVRRESMPRIAEMTT